MTLEDGALLRVGVNELPETYITILDAEERFHLSVTIAGDEHELGRYVELADAASRARRWVEGRGLVWRWDSARRLSECQRTDSSILIMYVVSRAQADAHDLERRKAWSRYLSDVEADEMDPSLIFWHTRMR